MSYLLEIELVPEMLWGESLAQKLPRSLWDRLRKACYANAGYRCEICGEIGKNGRLEAHEIWEYTLNIEARTGVQKLIRLIALCPNCHAFKHYGRLIAALPKDVQRTVIAHAANVNKWTTKEYKAYIKEAYLEWDLRNFYQWTQDLDTFLRGTDKCSEQ